MKETITLFVVFFGLVSVSGCDFSSDVLEDIGFQQWDGDQLLQWDIVEGEVRRIGTWHKHDYAVELVGASVVLTQVSDPEDTGPIEGNLRIELVADIDEAVDVTLEVDTDDDGNPELVEAVTQRDFAFVEWGVYAEGGPVRVTITKEGAGRAVLSQLRVIDVF